MALDAMLRVPLRLLELHEGHDFYTGEHSWNEVHEKHDLPAVNDASPAPQEDTDTESEQGQLHWTGDEDEGFLGRGLVDGGEMAFTVVPVRFKGCEQFEAKVLSGSDVDLTLPVSELATRYGTSITNGRKGRRRTLDPYPTSEEARERCETAYHSDSASAT